MTESTTPLLQLHPDDDVAVTREPVKAGSPLRLGEQVLTSRADVGRGHKLAIRPVRDGEPVRKYGQIIGFARGDIRPGDHVHLHNLGVRDFERDPGHGSAARPLPPLPLGSDTTFSGFLRPGGRAGTRNYVAILSSVNCSASVSKYVAERFRGPDFARDFPGVDGVVAFTHKSGCAMPDDEPTRQLQRVLAGIARHPNITGYVLIGLGCEVNQVDRLVKDFQLGLEGPDAVPSTVMNIQTQGGIARTVDAGVAAVRKLLPVSAALRRVPLPVSKLILAMNCGGSDGASGITANPALGVASDELVRHGGTSVLAETPEIYGAEHLLTRRAVSREVGERLMERIHWWEEHARQHGASIDNNPSVGNKAGGLTTIYEKSLGALAKGGQAPLAAVYQYAEKIDGPGLAFMDTPGFDPVSMTGLVCGGCTVGVFTTGRGSVYGCKPMPCIKVATNTTMYEWMKDDMDLNAGTILDGTETVAEVGQRLFKEIISVAGGKRTRSELHGLGDEEFAPWILGPTL
ncbi:MAG: altronate dehydratase [Verrucomicrobiales bacterium]|nr:altronate dehydratase [Verrucomicrobiales bacterium]